MVAVANANSAGFAGGLGDRLPIDPNAVVAERDGFARESHNAFDEQLVGVGRGAKDDHVPAPGWRNTKAVRSTSRRSPRTSHVAVPKCRALAAAGADGPIVVEQLIEADGKIKAAGIAAEHAMGPFERRRHRAARHRHRHHEAHHQPGVHHDRGDADADD